MGAPPPAPPVGIGGLHVQVLGRIEIRLRRHRLDRRLVLDVGDDDLVGFGADGTFVSLSNDIGVF